MTAEWIDIKDERPKIGQTCIVVAMSQAQWMATKWDGKEFIWADEFEYGESVLDPFPSEEVTHWMPFPEYVAKELAGKSKGGVEMIERWTPKLKQEDCSEGLTLRMWTDKDGDYVLYTDHLAAMQEKDALLIHAESSTKQ
ncbi:MAG: DUF551 domain-containing protein [Smithella sp.]|jgi:hypothetical protein